MISDNSLYKQKDTIIGGADYFTALNDVEKYALDSKKDSVLVKGLSLKIEIGKFKGINISIKLKFTKEMQ